MFDRLMKAVLRGIEPQYEQPGRGLSGQANQPSGVGIGATSIDVANFYDDPMTGLDSDGRPFFHDRPQYDTSGVDAMQGLANDARIVELANEEMWSEREDEFPFDIAGSYPSGHPLQPGTSVDAESWLE